MEICPGLSSPRVVEFLDVNPDVPAHLTADLSSDEDEAGHLGLGEGREATKEDWIECLVADGSKIVTRANAEFGVMLEVCINEYVR
eukprot:SAG22_NODE_114_length_19318_cov_13.809980_13_plen_86_part_00